MEMLLIATTISSILLVIMLVRKMISVTEKETSIRRFHDINGKLEKIIQERTVRLEESENRDQSLFQHFPSPTFYIDTVGNVLKRNKAAEEMGMYDIRNMHEFPLQKGTLKKHGKVKDVISSVLKGEYGTFEFSIYDTAFAMTRYFAMTSIPIHHKGELTNMYVILKETTREMMQEKQIYELAHYDTLTKLANRRTFEQRLAAHLSLASKRKYNIAVMFIDVDRFKIVNDTLGHHIGDELLKEVAKRLVVAVGSATLVARLGGDEFTILFYDFKDEKELAKISKVLLATFESPIILHEQVLKVTLSIGIAIHETGMDSATLMKNADSAMYYVKARGKNNYQMYNDAISDHYQRQFQIEKDLYKAIEHRQLAVYYQPLFCSRNNMFTGLEALVRWEHPSLGILSSTDFISIAEETGLIVSMGEWIIREACKKMKDLLDKGYNMNKMCVNISKKQLEKKNFVTEVTNILFEVGIAPSYIEFELVESALFTQDNDFLRIVNRLRNIGISIAIDDFGTGYSSLSYLANFCFPTLKLARELIEGVEENTKRATVVQAVLDLAHSLGFETIVEGIETKRQLEYFQGRCHYMQGFYLSKPLPSEQVETFLRQRYIKKIPPC